MNNIGTGQNPNTKSKSIPESNVREEKKAKVQFLMGNHKQMGRIFHCPLSANPFHMAQPTSRLADLPWCNRSQVTTAPTTCKQNISYTDSGISGS